MAAETPICNFGEPAKPFDLMGTDGKRYTLKDVRGPKGLLVMFICNHCPYVKAVLDRIIRDVGELKDHGIGAIAISANDPKQYPEDSFDNMKRVAAEKRFPFPYVFDKTQEVARAYGAVCTPDFFGYNADLELQYRGRLDASKTTPFRVRSASCTRRWCRSPRPVAGRRSRSRPWAARSSGGPPPEEPASTPARARAGGSGTRGRGRRGGNGVCQPARVHGASRGRRPAGAGGAPVSPALEITEIHTRLLAERGPAVLFERVEGSELPLLANLFGTVERVAWGMNREPHQLRELGELLAFFKQPEPPGGWRRRSRWCRS